PTRRERKERTMAKKKKTSRAASDLLQPRSGAPSSGEDLLRAAVATGSSGRYIVIFRPGASHTGTRTLQNRAGVASVASTADSDSGALEASQAGDNVLFDQLDMAVVDMEPDQVMGVASANDDEGVELIVPDGVKFATVLAAG